MVLLEWKYLQRAQYLLSFAHLLDCTYRALCKPGKLRDQKLGSSLLDNLQFGGTAEDHKRKCDCNQHQVHLAQAHGLPLAFQCNRVLLRIDHHCHHHRSLLLQWNCWWTPSVSAIQHLLKCLYPRALGCSTSYHLDRRHFKVGSMMLQLVHLLSGRKLGEKSYQHLGIHVCAENLTSFVEFPRSYYKDISYIEVEFWYLRLREFMKLWEILKSILRSGHTWVLRWWALIIHVCFKNVLYLTLSFAVNWL